MSNNMNSFVSKKLTQKKQQESPSNPNNYNLTSYSL